MGLLGYGAIAGYVIMSMAAMIGVGILGAIFAVLKGMWFE